jgi:hypothetical protein
VLKLNVAPLPGDVADTAVLVALLNRVYPTSVCDVGMLMLVEAPAHTAESRAEGVRLVGGELTLTAIELVLVQPKPSVIVNEYVPLIADVALEVTVGFSCDEVKPFGPVHA